MAKRKASDVFVECLEAEGVKHVFGIPGEETLDLNESLSDSSVEFVPELPKSGVGKILRREVRSWHWGDEKVRVGGA